MKIVAVTACVTGVAHTYIAAEVLERYAGANGIDIKVETQGAMGIENSIKLKDVKDSDAVILTNDVEIKGMDRFKGKIIFRFSSNEIVRRGDEILKKVKSCL
ncbi:MAG: fructose PTS transporter subunit IIB [Clostridium sp.]|jgi:fructose-specific PTS system IIB-like component|uniref:PTS fructose transporter subunit IIB n=1 Tax=Clostridium sp. TaxID=1506 RepID=UPI0025C7354E|nr:fructose PTS transporter subunit IIB [Clostridium sp.]MCH3964951.1 fructose PTS transporter subunit IIB [Clostridium sp.]MCI1716555.1 fructose PTS transporter subunit IIB [Clostridium sp.]MCI1800963.1 fructose PTS transporter subunit IIB [Clostridium sp.]MCI1814732.1 fructose PTS transporter subunit IIB [Clostridium sp.]MCI1871710.1 fructose PTS transporter subunit IIB [Clostridium sp.]